MMTRGSEEETITVEVKQRHRHGAFLHLSRP
jgi:hypothetical protein